MAQVDASPMAIFFAATRPERTSALILANASAKYTASDDYPIGVPAEVLEAFLAWIDQLWGTEAMVLEGVPSRANDERFRRWIAKAQRTVGSPRIVQAYMRAMFEVDARPILPLIHAPTLVLHRSNVDFAPIQHGRYLAEHLPGARLMAAAAPGETLTSRTVQDLVVGSDIVLEDRGTHRLKGVADPWQRYTLVRP
jgi:pimeloyl-ACP methyl ester carboxylesterase